MLSFMVRVQYIFYGPCLLHGLTAKDMVEASRPRIFNQAGKVTWEVDFWE